MQMDDWIGYSKPDPLFPMSFSSQVYSTRLAGALGLEQDNGGDGGAGSGRDSGLDGSETVLPTLSNEVRTERLSGYTEFL